MLSARFLLAGVCLAAAVTAVSQERTFETDILSETFGFDEQTSKSVSLKDLHQGCPARDCIPSIDRPKFVSAGDAKFLADTDVVLAIEHGGDARAYPTRILDRHEIVNDVIGGDPIAITWCPLCGSGLAFRRVVDGAVTEFGVSGVLYNSDLVFYDRASNTLWDQIEGKGIVGPLTGKTLEMLPLTVTRWSRWRQTHPDSRVLSTDTGHDKDYTLDPYARYRQSDRLMFPVSGTDARLAPKTVVYGTLIDGRYVAYTQRLLESVSPYKDSLGNRDLSVTLGADGLVKIEDVDTSERFVPVRLFWFAWYGFHPETTLRDAT